MKKYTWILGGLMAIAFTACTGDELMQNPEQQPAEGEVVTVTAYAPGNNTNSRVEFNESTTQGVSFDLSWSDDDKFSVIVDGSYQTFTKVSNSDNFFSGKYPAGSGTYYAVYPYIVSGDARATAVPFDLSTQTGELDADKTYMYDSSADGRAFSFSHCMSILKASFSFTGSTEDATIKQIKVTTPDAYKVNGTIDLSNSGTLTGATNGTNDITITIPVEEEPVSQAEEEEAYYIYLPPMTANNEGNTLNFEVTMSDDAVYTGTISRNGAIEAGKLYTATVVLEKENLSTDYIENGVNYGPGIALPAKDGGTIIWAPVNCGYTAENKHGLLYQWGRKYGQIYHEYYKNADRPSDPEQDDASKGFYVTNQSDWLTSKNDNLWYNNGKTKYDPCPEGWRVPTSNELLSLDCHFTVEDADFIATSEKVTIDDENDKHNGLTGIYFYGYTTSTEGNKVFFPSSGWITGNNVSAEGIRRNEVGYYWSSSTEGNFAKYMNLTTPSNSNKSEIKLFPRANRAIGISVRCVKE